MNKLLKDLTELADKHNLSITNLSIQEFDSETITNIEFVKVNRICGSVGNQGGC